MKTNDSPFNLMNDAAYVDGCGKEEYLKRVSEGVNHAEFVMGIGPEGVHDRLYMRFYQGASGGDEVFATYGWHYWEISGEPFRAPTETTGSAECCSVILSSTQNTMGDVDTEGPTLRASAGYLGHAPINGSGRKYNLPCGVKPLVIRGTTIPGRYVATHRHRYVGCYQTPEAAGKAYVLAAADYLARDRALRSRLTVMEAAEAQGPRPIITDWEGLALHMSNNRKNNTTGYRGVSKRHEDKPRKLGTYCAKYRGRIIGYFDTAVEAAAAYARRRLGANPE
jgi:hypothetical protein